MQEEIFLSAVFLSGMAFFMPFPDTLRGRDSACLLFILLTRMSSAVRRLEIFDSEQFRATGRT